MFQVFQYDSGKEAILKESASYNATPFKSSPPNTVRLWRIIERHLVADCRVFSVHKLVTHKIGEEDKPHHDFFVFKPSNWVNVIAITEDFKVVMVEQYRHGIEGLTLEIPGGMIDEEDGSSRIAGERELIEETGYKGQETFFLGRTHPNPAIQDNICDTYLVLGAKQVEVPVFHGTEEIALKVYPLHEISELIKNGKITHSLVITAFHFLQQFTFDHPEYADLNPFAR